VIQVACYCFGFNLLIWFLARLIVVEEVAFSYGCQGVGEVEVELGAVLRLMFALS